MNYQRLLLSSLALLGLGIITSSLPAKADGLDASLSRSISSSGRAVRESRTLDTTDKENQRQQTQVLAWENWSNPYVQEGNICRERNGNLVCLSSTSAEYLNW